MDMNQAMRMVMESAGLKPSLFAPNSRYQGIDTATLVAADGRMISYVRRRFVPPLAEHSLMQQHAVLEGDRLDNLSARYLGDPELFWRICDANDALRPAELTETPGAKVNIALPHGITGPADA